MNSAGNRTCPLFAMVSLICAGRCDEVQEVCEVDGTSLRCWLHAKVDRCAGWKEFFSAENPAPRWSSRVQVLIASSCLSPADIGNSQRTLPTRQAMQRYSYRYWNRTRP